MSDSKKVFVIDDEEDLCITVKVQLEIDGFIVETATDGRSGIERIKDFEPDIIILDLMMPEMNGFEVFRRLKADLKTASIPVVILTAVSQGEVSRKALSIGAAAYLIKPFEEDALLFTLHELLD